MTVLTIIRFAVGFEIDVVQDLSSIIFCRYF